MSTPYPKTYRAIRRSAKPYPLRLEFTTETLPETLAAKDVVLRIRAASLNYRDVAMLREGGYPIPVNDGEIQGSCCAAEVVAVGSSVTKFSIGDRVAPTANLNFLTGEEKDADVCALGGDAPGALREWAVFAEKHLVQLPGHVSWEEAATITGVGITAWNALNALEHVAPSATALLQGTGGVSIMSLLVCLAAGITPFVTSSSDAKLARLRKISPRVVGINYKATPDLAAEVLRLTHGKGVDYVLNNVGLSSIPEDLRMLRRYGGSIALIGFLEGFEAGWDAGVLMGLIEKAASIKGILAGSRADMEAVSRFLDEKKVDLGPLVDRVFAFEEAEKAFAYLESGSHVGKVVLRM
ncbi:NAD(P)-binding protein [Karstenula rhodostoma CBS 690.94]|uniref:NAD(P)-binding protein n=1 Tax=Karstenula rhodostoma CBS 690.94 TaxID=1392251 RepID=A0A9P4P867_9PLEO|nr:NAD(P)-binding protein [Karstenula rhodostoma CBS 690.94]